MIVKEIKKIDSKGRVVIPKYIIKALELENSDVYFEISRAKNLVIKKVKDKEKNAL